MKSSLSVFVLLTLVVSSLVRGQAKDAAQNDAGSIQRKSQFINEIQPILKQFCFDCHGADTQESGIRVDRLDGSLEDRQLFLLKHVMGQLKDGNMPPEDEPQLSSSQRTTMVEWIERTLLAGQKRVQPKNGSTRRLTVAQYQNTLRDLLGIEEQLAELLPADGISAEGFQNNVDTLLLTPQMMETYFEIADRALDICLVDEKTKPRVQCFRVEFGSGVNQHPVPEKIQLNGPRLLRKTEYTVREVVPEKPFAFEPLAMQKRFRFIEGYIGNGTIRQWKDFEGLYHTVFAAQIGQHTGGYNYGRSTVMIPEGLLIRPRSPESRNGSAPSRGPAPTLSMPMRELPNSGILQVTVEAARYDDGYQPTSPAGRSADRIVLDIENGKEASLEIPNDGVYQVDVLLDGSPRDDVMTIDVAGRTFGKRLKGKFEPNSDGEVVIPLLVARFSTGMSDLKVGNGDGATIRKALVTRVAEESDQGTRFAAFEKTVPYVSVHMGIRTDVGARLSRFAEPKPVPSSTVERYSFRAPVSEFATHDTTEENVNYLAGLREIAIRSEPTDGRQIPRVLVHAVEIEGPYYESWPPRAHRDIFFDSENTSESEAYAREVLDRFATRAYRRPPIKKELDSLMQVWQASFDRTKDFQLSVRHALLVALTSPQFLFITEESTTPKPEVITPHELAAKLSYLLWNTMPDERLSSLASEASLTSNLSQEIDRMIKDERFAQFADDFVSQWLSLDKFDVVNVNHGRFPKLNRETKRELRKEPIQFVAHLIRNNLPLRNLVDSEFIIANDVVAGYYGIGDRTSAGYHFEVVRHENESLGGVLTQAAILSGLSDGSESNPVKRGAWLARKIIAEPPEPPPPNVPELSDDDEAKSLRERLEMHRNQKGCMACHQKIDPWGLPLEQFNAGGLLKQQKVDAGSMLPDGREISSTNELKQYLAEDRIDQVAYSFSHAP